MTEQVFALIKNVVKDVPNVVEEVFVNTKRLEAVVPNVVVRKYVSTTYEENVVSHAKAVPSASINLDAADAWPVTVVKSATMVITNTLV